MKLLDRSIPAYAGDPCFGIFLAFLVMVYPRLRGGSGEALGLAYDAGGLSPPTRGIRSASFVRRTF